jgi:hypothetical protein
MTASAFANRSPADQYLVRRISARDRVDIESLATLPAHELDRLLPGGRAAYQHRAQVADALLTSRGIDPTTSEYRAADEQARDILARVDRFGSDHAA